MQTELKSLFVPKTLSSDDPVLVVRDTQMHLENTQYFHKSPQPNCRNGPHLVFISHKSPPFFILPIYDASQDLKVCYSAIK